MIIYTQQQAESPRKCISDQDAHDALVRHARETRIFDLVFRLLMRSDDKGWHKTSSIANRLRVKPNLLGGIIRNHSHVFVRQETSKILPKFSGQNDGIVRLVRLHDHFGGIDDQHLGRAASDASNEAKAARLARAI